MRKLFTGIVVALFAVVLFMYLLIPSSLAVSEVEMADCTLQGAFRTLSDVKKWSRWWPGQAHDSAAAFQYKGNGYRIAQVLKNTFHINIQRDGEEINTTLFLLPLPPDSMALQWKCRIVAGNNPFNKIQRYVQARRIKNNMGKVLQHLKAYLQKRENIYGIQIQNATTHDTLLIATNAQYTSYPTTEAVYHMIHSLQQHAAAQQARPTGNPMLNVTMLDSGRYRVQAALPVNKRLNDQGAFFFRRMVPGKFIATEVRGGIHTVNNAWRQLHLYLQDYQEVAMAMPFEYLVTNRMQEPDTSKWVTRLFVPVYYEVDPLK